MKKLSLIFLKWIIFGLGFFLVIYIWINIIKASSLSTVNSWDVLSDSTWNTMISTINSLDTKVSTLTWNLQFDCQSVWGAAYYKWNVNWFWAYSNIKRAQCSVGYKVTWCSTTDTPQYLGDRAFSYTFPWFMEPNWTWIAGEWCQWTNTFNSSANNDAFYWTNNRNVIARCCRIK